MLGVKQYILLLHRDTNTEDPKVPKRTTQMCKVHDAKVRVYGSQALLRAGVQRGYITCLSSHSY